MIKSLIKLGMKWTCLGLIKDVYERPADVILNGERTEYFPLLTGNIIAGCPFSHTVCIKTCGSGPVSALRQEDKIVLAH